MKFHDEGEDHSSHSLSLEEVQAANTALDHFPEVAVLPRLSAGQVLDERNDSVEWHRHSGWANEIAESLLTSVKGGLPFSTDRWGPHEWNDHILRTLVGELYYVTDDMARMAEFAGQSLPEDLRITNQLFPAQHGTFRLEQPRYVIDIRGARLGITAIGWSAAVGRK